MLIKGLDNVRDSAQAGEEAVLSPVVICGYPTVGFLAHLIGADAWFISLSPAFYLVLMAAALRDAVVFRKIWLRSWMEIAFTGALLLGALLSFMWIFNPTDLIPAYDSIVVPAYSRFFIEYATLTPPLDVEGRTQFLYPPGFSMFLLGAFKVMNPVDVLVLFKWICVVAVALTPFTWALLCRFGFGMKSTAVWALCGLVYVSFVLFDRSILYGLVVAGKNSQLLQSCLIPLFLIQLLKVRNASAILCASVTGCGLFLIHFSGLYMTGIFLVSWSISVLLAGGGLNSLIRQWAAFCGAFLLFSPQAWRLAQNASFLSPATGQSSDGPAALLGIFASKFNKFVFIFNEVGHPWPYKGAAIGLFILLVLGFLLLEPPLRLRRGLASDEARGFVALIGAWLGSALASYRIVPIPGINMDYCRWFSYNFLAAGVAVGILVLLKMTPRRLWWVMLGGLAAVLGSGVLYRDIVSARQTIERQAFLRSELRPVVNLVPNDHRCKIITSNSGPGPVVLQSYRPFEYISTLSPCEVISGSYGTYNSYLLDPQGRPRVEHVARALSASKVFYLGASADSERFFSTLPKDEFRVHRLKSFKAFSVWEIVIASQGERSTKLGS